MVLNALRKRFFNRIQFFVICQYYGDFNVGIQRNDGQLRMNGAEITGNNGNSRLTEQTDYSFVCGISIMALQMRTGVMHSLKQAEHMPCPVLFWRVEERIVVKIGYCQLGFFSQRVFAGHDAEVFFIIERKRMNVFDMIDKFMRRNDKRSRVIEKGCGKLSSLSLTGLDCAIGIFFCKSADHSWKFRACWNSDVLNRDFCVLVRSEQALLLSTVIDLQNF